MKLKIIIIFLLIVFICIAGRVEIYHKSTITAQRDGANVVKVATQVEFETWGIRLKE